MPSRAMRTALFLLVTLAALPVGAQGPPQRAPQATVPATGSVRGRVTSANGVPLRGAEVRVRDPNGRENRLVTTDEEGRYEVNNLVPGTWSVSAAKGGYITQQYGQRGPFSAAQPITLAARQRVDASFVLRPGGAIAGRLFDEYGDPVAGARVQALRQRYERGRRQLTTAGVGDQTDDTGAFRLYALPPGDYYMAASLRAAGAVGIVEATVGVPTYYPGTPSLGEAQRLRLGPGEEMAGISFAAQPVRSVTVSGAVVLASGAPARDTSVTLTAEGGGDFGIVSTPLGNFGRTAADGTFTMPSVAPGSYLLRARAGAVFDPITGQGEEALVPLVVGPEGVSGLTVTTIRTPPIAGTVVADSGTPLPNAPIGIGVREPTTGTDFMMTARRPRCARRRPHLPRARHAGAARAHGGRAARVDAESDRDRRARRHRSPRRVEGVGARRPHHADQPRDARVGHGAIGRSHCWRGHRRAVCRRRRQVEVSHQARDDGARRRSRGVHRGGAAATRLSRRRGRRPRDRSERGS
jgi:hypothetical protein